MERKSVDVDGVAASYLTAGADTNSARPAVVLLHGTYWSRVWQPVLEDLAAAGLRPIAVDLPGLGRSSGELDVEHATVPALAAWVVRFLHALAIDGPVYVAGHDIGGGIAQQLLVDGQIDVSRLALVNGVMFDSWPAPSVARYRDPAVAAATTAGDILAARRTSVIAALARPASEQEIAEYLEPWTDPRVARSWLALARAADARYTLELVPALRASAVPKLLVWGEDDAFQKVEYAERFVREIPHTTLVRIAAAGHIPTENNPQAVAHALIGFFT
ncbi:alpha/beta fold hydrolase [Paraburkholderia solisilvae]|uniref:2-succinyl-6-hydroxy-2, 4-cyclohexadiene-1-carboxylate synthase n=1 Tax=Paraburkholderia solisilvae TaxID=624376 RepID=A0A6J5E319_9BURK|nr:alpha/beta hydrolase [Paraburkholderia solisilvae]CAB3760064.1 2-succinyl-6-hydroxy-2, 4-cyclohexadiene-1-carboxylate synthase [Paraburkholderia solisilvae]